MKTVDYRTSELVFAEYNPRKISEDQLNHLKDSINQFGFVDPLIVNVHPDRKGILVGGHQRAKAALSLGIEIVPCVEVTLDLEAEKELNIRLNKNTGEWDWELLSKHFSDDDLIDFGFDPSELELPDDEDFDENIEEVAEGLAKEDILLRYDLVFNTEDEMAKWTGFLSKVAHTYREKSTVAERVIGYIEDHDGL